MCFGFMLFLVMGAALDGPAWWKAIIGVIISGVIMVVGRSIAILEDAQNLIDEVIEDYQTEVKYGEEAAIVRRILQIAKHI